MADITLYRRTASSPADSFDIKEQLEYVEEVGADDESNYLALLEFAHPILVLPRSLLLASRLDADIRGYFFIFLERWAKFFQILICVVLYFTAECSNRYARKIIARRCCRDCLFLSAKSAVAK